MTIFIYLTAHQHISGHTAQTKNKKMAQLNTMCICKNKKISPIP